MIDRFTQKAREAICLAVETAQELEHGYVGTEHLLLGLIKEETGVAAAVLAEHDVTEERVMELMERLISPAVATQVEGQIEYTPGARAVLQASYDEAVFFKAPLIGTEHILIAIIKDGKSTACRLLNTMNVNIQKLYVDLMGARVMMRRPRQRKMRQQDGAPGERQYTESGQFQPGSDPDGAGRKARSSHRQGTGNETCYSDFKPPDEE